MFFVRYAAAAAFALSSRSENDRGGDYYYDASNGTVGNAMGRIVPCGKKADKVAKVVKVAELPQ